MKPFFSSLLSVLLALQMPVGVANAQDPPPAKLDIVIIEGEGAVNNIRQRIAREPVVEVRDENRKPVAGAAVVFTLPNNGATGVFANGSKILTMTTDQAGRATMTGFRPGTPGQMQIRVTASHRGQTASATVTQTNVLSAAAAGGAAGAGAAGMSTAKIVTILAIIGGAAAAGGAVAATRGGGSSPAPGGVTPPSPTVISPGNPSVGPPR
ncbi:MAG: hypothetical protein HY820_22665 [Acidobacteria bacterium]|nr:hypothetical protein [Acidobacteriota bacterium]